MSVKTIMYKGKTIVFADYRGLLKPEQQLQTLDQLGQLLKMSSTGTYLLSNFEDISIGTEFMNRAKDLGKEHQAKLKRQAYLGVTGLKNILLQGFLTFSGTKEAKTFDNETIAKDWLVS
jgi:hypothetical protein